MARSPPADSSLGCSGVPFGASVPPPSPDSVGVVLVAGGSGVEEMLEVVSVSVSSSLLVVVVFVLVFGVVEVLVIDVVTVAVLACLHASNARPRRFRIPSSSLSRRPLSTLEGSFRKSNSVFSRALSVGSQLPLPSVATSATRWKSFCNGPALPAGIRPEPEPPQALRDAPVSARIAISVGNRSFAGAFMFIDRIPTAPRGSLAGGPL